jgi:RNA polymerase sigma factor (sigma-70 family)
LIARYQQRGDQEALCRLITSNAGLVVNIASPYAHTYGVDLEDLAQEGLIGLLHSIDRFDLSLPYKLSTYATMNIQRFVVRALSRYTHAIYLPDRVFAGLHKVKRLLEAPEASDVTVESLARHTGESVATMEATLRWLNPAVSLDVPVSSESDVTLAQLVGAYDEDMLSEVHDRDELATLLAALSDERKLAIIRWSYGLGCNKLTFVAIGKRLGISKERARKIHDGALKELRAAAGRIAS